MKTAIFMLILLVQGIIGWGIGAYYQSELVMQMANTLQQNTTALQRCRSLRTVEIHQ